MRPISQIRIDANGPFDHAAALDTLAAHAVTGLHLLDPGSRTLTRRIDVGGDSHRITLRLTAAGVELTTPTADEGVNATLANRARSWFDLSTDLTPINARLAEDPVFAPQVRSHPGVRVTRFHSPFEAAVLTVLGQQVSLEAGRLFAARLVASHGRRPETETSTDGLRDFPSPATMATVPQESLRAQIGLTRSRARTLHEIAELFMGVDVGERLPSRDELRAVHGVGPWTVEYLALRASDDRDAYPGSDAVLRRSLIAADPAADASRSEAWGPYRAYAASRLWAGSL